MGRIRTIKPEFFKHAALYDAEIETELPLRVAYAGLWTCCDREGRFKWRPRALKLNILPYDNCDFSRVLDALTTRGFLVKYASENDTFGFVPTFLEHQVINNRESGSVLPNPCECNTIDASATREAREGHAAVGEGKGREGKGREGAVEDAPVFCLPEWVPIAPWKAWLEIRKKKKAANTVHALELAVKELDKLRQCGEDPTAVLDQSTLKSYTGLFAAKSNGNGNGFHPEAPKQKSQYEVDRDRQFDDIAAARKAAGR